jgi:CRP/FNR family cyclic AMP-dependent transcriptional regulator
VSSEDTRDEQDRDTTQIRGRILEEALVDAGFSDPFLGSARPETWAPLLRNVELFKGLSSADLRRIADVSKIAQVSAGQIIVREGLSSEAFYVQLTGIAMVYRGETVIAHSRRGDYYGEIGLLDGSTRTASVIADSDLWVVRIPRDAFFRLIEQHPSIAQTLLVGLAERYRRLEGTGSANPT